VCINAQKLLKWEKSEKESKKRTLEEMKKLQRNVWEERRKSTKKKVERSRFQLLKKLKGCKKLVNIVNGIQKRMKMTKCLYSNWKMQLKRIRSC
jgi:hypothetical protein